MSHLSITLKKGSIIYAIIMMFLSLIYLVMVKVCMNSIYYQISYRDLWLVLPPEKMPGLQSPFAINIEGLSQVYIHIGSLTTTIMEH